MLDGSDIDILIKKKRVHLTIMAEAFNSTKRPSKRLILKKKKEERKKDDDEVVAQPSNDSFGN